MSEAVGDLASLIEQRDKAWREWCRFNKQVDEHPDTKAKKERERRRRLEKFLPDALHHLLLNQHHPGFGHLLEVTTEYVDDGGFGQPDIHWRFSAIFSKSIWEADVPWDKNGFLERPNEFCLVDYHRDPLQLWYVCKHENDDQVPQALAAFTFACCEQLNGDWEAAPSKAFSTASGKKEIVS